MSYYDQVKEAADAIRARVSEIPAGRRSCSARGSAISPARSADAVSMPYGELPHWPASRVIGHEGRLVVGTAPAGRSPRWRAGSTSTKATMPAP